MADEDSPPDSKVVMTSDDSDSSIEAEGQLDDSEVSRDEGAQTSGPLLITDPPNDFVFTSPAPVFRGTWEGMAGRFVRIKMENGQPFTIGSMVDNAGRWRVEEPVYLSAGSYKVFAEGSYKGDILGRSSILSIHFIFAPVIFTPVPDNEAFSPVIFSGIASPNSLVDLFYADGNPLKMDIPVSFLGYWITSIGGLPFGQEIVVKARVRFKGQVSGWSTECRFTVKPGLSDAPEITGPDANSIQDSVFTVIGIGAREGETLEILRDLTEHDCVGSSTGDGEVWAVTVRLVPGTHSLIAVRHYSDSFHSARSAPRAFRIRPPALTAVTVTNPTTNSIEFSGYGYKGATIVITGNPDNTTIREVIVAADGRWNVTSFGWPFGIYSLRAMQKVPDGANGWIISQHFGFFATMALPDVSEVIYKAEYTPVFSGAGINGATVRFFDEGGADIPAPETLVSDGEWTSQATQIWGPTWKRAVRIKQFLNGQQSANYVTILVDIPPLRPTLDTPTPDGRSPKFSGMCWAGAVVNIRFSDSDTVHTATVIGDRWSYRRGTDFSTGVTHTVTVTQTAAEQTSPAATLDFTVALPTPRIDYPTPDLEVGSELVVTGENGVADATLQLRDYLLLIDLGQPVLLTQDGPWSITVKNLDLRVHKIDARQKVGEQFSAFSAPVQFKVVLQAPEFVVPAEQQKCQRVSRISGKGMPGAWVKVWRLDPEQLLFEVLVNEAGDWSEEVTQKVGNVKLQAMQTFKDHSSPRSPVRTYSVVADTPFMETPAPGEHRGHRITVSGFATPGDTVKVWLLGFAAASVQGVVQGDRTWSVTLNVADAVPGGNHVLLATASCEGFESLETQPRPIRLGMFMPLFERPVSGSWPVAPIVFRLQVEAGVGWVSSWWNPDQRWTAATPTAGQVWQGTAQQPLPPGGNWCMYMQEMAGGTTVSHKAWSARFEVAAPQKNNR